jgi:hypothetical protein
MTAVERGDLNSLQLLLNAGADVVLKDSVCNVKIVVQCVPMCMGMMSRTCTGILLA